MEIDDIQNRIIEEMAATEAWLDKYEYLVEQGRRLDPLGEDLRDDANAISGCQSKVWLHAVFSDGKLHFRADSDTLITKGMIALLLRVLNHRRPRHIIGADLYFIQKTGLASHLSPSRANGLMAIVNQIKRYARDHAVPEVMTSTDK
jgi:cysteine desulfuration protein SufE